MLNKEIMELLYVDIAPPLSTALFSLIVQFEMVKLDESPPNRAPPL